MTEKQEKIVNAALQLFAKNGFDGTSTSKVAKEAGVSEGLIFRHFGNKEGLLNAIMKLGRDRSESHIQSILGKDDPLDILKSMIEMIFSMKTEDRTFWKLIYMMKWNSDVYDDSMSKPLKVVLLDVFQSLNYDNPEAEAECFMLILDGMVTTLLVRKPANQAEIKNSLMAKYGL